MVMRVEEEEVVVVSVAADVILLRPIVADPDLALLLSHVLVPVLLQTPPRDLAPALLRMRDE